MDLSHGTNYNGVSVGSKFITSSVINHASTSDVPILVCIFFHMSMQYMEALYKACSTKVFGCFVCV